MDLSIKLDINLPRATESYPKTRQIFRFYSMMNPERLTRQELLSGLEKRKIQLVGGRWVQGYSGNIGSLRNFTKRHLLELLEGSKPLTEQDRERLRVGVPYLTGD